MKTRYLLSLIAASCLALSGCVIMGSPAAGSIYTDVKWGDTATQNSQATKQGTACATAILGFATGDASVEAAKEDGDITEVTHVDHTTKNILGIWGEFCTIVYGR